MAAHGRQQYCAAGTIRPVPDKYAFQATDKRTNERTDEQTNRRTSLSSPVNNQCTIRHPRPACCTGMHNCNMCLHCTVLLFGKINDGFLSILRPLSNKTEHFEENTMIANKIGLLLNCGEYNIGRRFIDVGNGRGRKLPLANFGRSRFSARDQRHC